MVTKKEKLEKQPKLIDGIKSYFKGVRSEWGKVTWPEKQQVLHEVLAVLVVVLFFTGVVFFYDKIIELLLGLIPQAGR